MCCVVGQTEGGPVSYYQEIVQSPWTSVLLAVAAFASLLIGALALNGHFCALEVAHANALSYAMFAVSGFFFAAFHIKTLLCIDTQSRGPGI